LTIGTSLFLIAVGAILKFAVTAHVAGIDLQTVGVILMIVGGVGLAIGLWLYMRGRTTTTVSPPPAPPPV
jgi:Flp pilus assembly protein protease CpaA